MHAYVLVYILAASLNISSLIGLWNLSGESRLTFDVGNDSRDLLQSIAVVLPALLIHSNLFTSVSVTICLCRAIIKMCESLICGLYMFRLTTMCAQTVWKLFTSVVCEEGFLAVGKWLGKLKFYIPKIVVHKT